MLKSNVEFIKKQIIEAIENASREIGITGTAELQSNAPVDKGLLKKSLTFKKAKEGTKYTITFGSSIAYAPHTEFRNKTSKGWMRQTMNGLSSEAIAIITKHLRKVGK